MAKETGREICLGAQSDQASVLVGCLTIKTVERGNVQFNDYRGLFFIEGLSSNRHSSQCVHCGTTCSLGGTLSTSPAVEPGEASSTSASSTISLGIRAFPEWNFSVEIQVSLQARPIVTSPSKRGACQVSPCGLGPLVY